MYKKIRFRSAKEWRRGQAWGLGVYTHFFSEQLSRNPANRSKFTAAVKTSRHPELKVIIDAPLPSTRKGSERPRKVYPP